MIRQEVIAVAKPNAKPKAGILMLWGQPVRGREKQANKQLQDSVRYLKRLEEQGQIERYDCGGFASPAEDLWGFILLHGTTDQIDALRRTEEYARWGLRVSLVADHVRIFDTTLDEDALTRNMDFYDETIQGL
jgi:hypothetical protein